MVRHRCAAVAGALAIALLGSCRTSRARREEWQHTMAFMMHPADVRAPPGVRPPAEIRTLRLLAYADADYQAHAPDWRDRLLAQVGRANALVEAQFGVRFEVAVQPWERRDRSVTLKQALQELESMEWPAGADWVVGFVGPSSEDAWIDTIGVAELFRPYVVLRAMMSSAELAAIGAAYDTLSEAERQALAEERRLHREVVTFLHEWAHTLGAVHECDLKWIMAREYAVVSSAFSPESERLVRAGLLHRDPARGPPGAAWRDAWRAEARRMEPVAWECAALEKGLAESAALLSRIEGQQAGHGAGR